MPQKFGSIVYICSTECQLIVHKESLTAIKSHHTVSGTDTTNIKIGFDRVNSKHTIEKKQNCNGMEITAITIFRIVIDLIRFMYINVNL